MVELQTSSLLFPAISLLMLAYTNRYLALAALIRKLHSDYKSGNEPEIRAQIRNLRFRMRLIRQMQGLAVCSLLCCMACILTILSGARTAGTILFASAVVVMAASLVQSLREILHSGGALDILLKDLEAAQSGRRREL